jgi:hypothetical protein
MPLTDSTHEQLQAIDRAARRLVDIVESDSSLRWLYSTQFDASHRMAWAALVQALFDGRSLHDQAMAQFHEQRDAAIKRSPE